MPELPEVETIRRALEPDLRGRRVVAAGSHPSTKFTPAVEVVGATFETIGRRGKYLLCALDDDRELVIHLGMTGQLAVLPVAAEAAMTEAGGDPYRRAWWTLDDGRTLTFRDVRRFGRVRVVPTGDYAGIATLAAIGPEPFDDAFTPETLWRSIRASRRPIKTQLLSQVPVAGVGNIYADEACWIAAVHPAARRLTRRQAGALHEALRDVLAQGIRHGGTTLRDYRTVDGSEGENQHHLICYGRAGEPCERCGTALSKLVFDGRTSTFCPRCQRSR